MRSQKKISAISKFCFLLQSDSVRPLPTLFFCSQHFSIIVLTDWLYDIRLTYVFILQPSVSVLINESVIIYAKRQVNRRLAAITHNYQTQHVINVFHYDIHTVIASNGNFFVMKVILYSTFLLRALSDVCF